MNYLKISLRNLSQQKSKSILHIIGLTVAMLVFLLILSNYIFETNFDTFHQNYHNIYRVTTTNAAQQTALSNAPLGASLKDAFPEQIEDFTRALRVENALITLPNHKQNILQKDILFVEKNFLHFFSFPLVGGKSSEILTEQNAVVITEGLAKSFFGSKDAVGQDIVFNDKSFGKLVCKVTGVLKDIPQNSHIKFKMLISLGQIDNIVKNVGPDQYQLTNWSWQNFYTYISLKSAINVNELEQKFPEFINVYGIKGSNLSYSLQPLKAIHLLSNMNNELEVNGNIDLINTLIIVAVFIMFIIWINYMNSSVIYMSTQPISCDANVCNKKNSMYYFITDTLVLNVIALIASISIFYILMKYVFGIIDFQDYYTDIFTHKYFYYFVLMCFIGAFVSGILPSLLIPSHNPYSFFKLRRFQYFLTFFRVSSVVFQVSALMVLVVGVYVVYNQIRYLRGKDLGLNTERLIVINGPNILSSNPNMSVKKFTKKLRAMPNVESVSLSGSVPGFDANFGMGFINRENVVTKTDVNYEGVVVDENYINTYNINLLAGRNFNSKNDNDTLSNKVIINEEALSAMKFTNAESAVGETFLWHEGRRIEIIGVIKNFQNKSLKHHINPLCLFYGKSNNYISLRFKTGEDSEKCVNQLLKSSEKEFYQEFANSPFDFFFMDSFFNKLNLKEQHFDDIVLLLLALSIGVFWTLIYALTRLIDFSSAETKFDNKALKKIFNQIIDSLTLDLVLLVLLSSLIAFPIIYFFTKVWLENYAYHIMIDWTLFVVPSAIVIGLFVLTVILQTFRNVRINQDAVLNVENSEMMEPLKL
ncbi:MAG: ABC transporter permease [Arcicella sp.]|jgi:putative ABC transport system permease protein|nr:ABC transporter permease [Arcicella sp.]